ncbi:hypothetical protein F2Q68_00035812 [Brassica cretica]|uniref:Uncharacterized protein n=1 Tax=Brassica cretica TaxID=69181 RepID=A0A8S9H1B1_BRACR|nr:hypothetical protein F2Q68_00035812 [Brassica cretica]
MHNTTRELPSPTHDDTSGYNSDAAGLRSRRKQISASSQSSSSFCSTSSPPKSGCVQTIMSSSKL